LQVNAESAFRETLVEFSSSWDAPNILNTVADSLPDHIFAEFFTWLRRSEDEKHRTSAILALEQFLPRSLRNSIYEDALRTARALRNAKERAEALTQVALKSVEEEQTSVVAEAVDALCLTEPNYHRLEALEPLAPLLKEALLERAAQVACEIESDFELSIALPLLMPNAHDELRCALLRKALTIEDGGVRARALRNMVAHSPHAMATDMLAAAREFLRHARELAEFDALDLDEMFRRADLGNVPKRTHWSDHGMEEAAIAILEVLSARVPEILNPEELDLASKPKARASRHPNQPVMLTVAEAHAALARVADNPENDDQDRIRELSYLIPKLPEDCIAKALDLAYETGGPTLSRALDLLGRRISAQSSPRLMADLLGRADRLSRAELYDLLPTLYRGLLAIGGESALREVHRAITDTAKWFP
jgi:hypothetical protein